MEEKDAQLQMYERELKQFRLQADNPANGTAVTLRETAQLRERCNMLSKERRAVQTIMEQKVKTLVEAIAKAAAATVQGTCVLLNLNGWSRLSRFALFFCLLGRPDRGGVAGNQLGREVAALQRLINASIAALKNAESTAGPPVRKTSI